MIRKLGVEAITADRIREEATKQVTMAAREVFKRLPTIQEATSSWLNQYQKGRFEITVDTSELSKEVDKLGGIGRQVVIGIMLVGMIIGSAIATSVLATTEISGIWEAIFRMAYFGYIFAMVIAIIIVIKLVWDWLRGKKAV